MDYNKFKDIIIGRRSFRKFKDEPVPIEVLEELIDCARWAPSDTNSQPWRFIATSNKKIIKRIEKATLKGMDELKAQAEIMGKPEIGRKVNAFGRYALVFRNAPTIILCLAESYQSKFTQEIFDPIDFDKIYWRDEGLKSASLACQNILLAAHTMGYGTCPMSAPMILAENEIKKELFIEDKYIVMLLIAIGKPEGSIVAPLRKSVSDILEIIE